MILKRIGPRYFASMWKKEEITMYALDLEKSIRKVKPSLPVKGSVQSGMIEGITGILHCEERFAKGDEAVCAFLRKELVAYLFAARTDTRVDEVDDLLIVGKEEVYLYDAFTLPAYRGSGIYPFLLNTAAMYFKKQAYSFALIFSTADNRSSIRGIEKSGFTGYGSVSYRKFLGWKSWDYRIGERHVNSRFEHEC